MRNRLQSEIMIQTLHKNDITTNLFASFVRHQIVDTCWRKTNGKWGITSDPFIDDWTEADYKYLIQCLHNTITTGGVVYGAFLEGALKGFCSVESEFFGKKHEYLDLTSIHVSEDMRGQGIGKQLFAMAAEWARLHGAKKLYLSAHSAVETQAFYKALGCVHAVEHIPQHADAEPFDCQLEFIL